MRTIASQPKQVAGQVARGFETVGEAFAQNFLRRGELGRVDPRDAALREALDAALEIL